MCDSASVPKIKLNTGAFIPAVGHGGWCPPEDSIAQSKVKGWLLTALENGYRHFDTAQMYRTEAALGSAVKESGIPREEVFITTKLDWYFQDRVAESFEDSLKALGVEYVDLFLIHWPQPLPYETNRSNLPRNHDGSVKVREDINFNQAWADMEKLVERGKAKAIGVSNFSIKTLEELAATAKMTPAVNQVELHPYLVQESLRDYCAKKGIVLTAYAPSGWDRLRSDPAIVEIAGKYAATPNQIILAWHLARDVVLIPKSEDSGRQKENITLPALSPDDVLRISNLDRGERLCGKLDEFGQAIGWSAERLGW